MAAALVLAAGLLWGLQVKLGVLARSGPMLPVALGGVGLLCGVAAVLVGPSPAAKPGPVRAVITDALGPGQVSEQVTVVLAGRRLGVVRIDQQSPTASVGVSFPRAGLYPVLLEARRQLSGAAPTQVSNQGRVLIDAGTSRLIVLSDPLGRTYLAPQH